MAISCSVSLIPDSLQAQREEKKQKPVDGTSRGGVRRTEGIGSSPRHVQWGYRVGIARAFEGPGPELRDSGLGLPPLS